MEKLSFARTKVSLISRRDVISDCIVELTQPPEATAEMHLFDVAAAGRILDRNCRRPLVIKINQKTRNIVVQLRRAEERRWGEGGHFADRRRFCSEMWPVFAWHKMLSYGPRPLT